MAGEGFDYGLPDTRCIVKRVDQMGEVFRDPRPPLGNRILLVFHISSGSRPGRHGTIFGIQSLVLRPALLRGAGRVINSQIEAFTRVKNTTTQHL
jgi:hypothetical protein